MKFRALEPIDLKNNIDALAIVEIPLSLIFPDLNQPRKIFHENTLEELAASIKQYGLIQPILVRRITIEHYQIISGERRWRASKLAKLETIPVIVRSDKLEDNAAISLIENIQREELNPIELAEAFRRLAQDHHLSHEAIAKMIGKGRATVTNALRLLNLAKEVQILLVDKKLEMGHARALLALPSGQQIVFAQAIIEKKLTVRDVEKLVQRCTQPQKIKKAYYSDEVNLWIKKLSSRLSFKVAIDINESGGGKMIIHFASPEEADWLVNHFTD